MKKPVNYSGRRKFLKNLSIFAVGSLALSGCGPVTMKEFLQKNFRTLSKKEKDDIIKDLEKKYTAKYGKEFHVTDEPAAGGVEFGYALDLSRCVGCRRCVYACVKENNQSRDPQIQYIQVLQMEKEKGIDFAPVSYTHLRAHETVL